MRTDEFYAFMRERESIRLKKEAGEPWPWTDDEVLRTYKFTNVKRAHDRTTRELGKIYEYHVSRPPEEKLLNCALYRYFGTYEFARVAGWVRNMESASQKRVIELARERLAAGERVFTGAYVVTNQGIARPKQEVVVECFLAPLWQAASRLTARAKGRNSWQELITDMSALPGFGGTGFMAKETVLDLAFCDFWRTPDGLPADKNDWCPAGPGARRGVARVLGRGIEKKVSGPQALQVMKDLFAERFSHWPEGYVELELHDIQFQLCEFDKWCRVLGGEGKPRSLYHPPREVLS